MSGSGNRANTMDAKISKFVPEMSASKYARYPLTRERWLMPTEFSPEQKPCFIKGTTANGPPPIMEDYVFGRGPAGEGYYHLLTKESYKSLDARLTNEGPPVGDCCLCLKSKAARLEYDAYDDVKRLVYNRSVASKPDDLVATQDAMNVTKETAKGWHNGQQQAVGAMQFATR